MAHTKLNITHACLPAFQQACGTVAGVSFQSVISKSPKYYRCAIRYTQPNQLVKLGFAYAQILKHS